MAHSTYHIWCTGCFIPEGVFIEYCEFTSTVNTREREKVSGFDISPLFSRALSSNSDLTLRQVQFFGEMRNWLDSKASQQVSTMLQSRNEEMGVMVWGMPISLVDARLLGIFLR